VKVVAAVAVLTLAGVGGVSQLPASSSTLSSPTSSELQLNVQRLDALTQPTTVEQWSPPITPAPIAEVVESERARAAEAARIEAERLAQAQRAANAEAARKRAAETARQQAAAAKAEAAQEAARIAAARRATPAPSAPASEASMLSKMDALARCESGGNPTIVSRNGRYYGAFQFALGTWRSVGYEGTPIDYSYEVQREAAIKLQQRSGWGQWPTCSRKLGYL
jgi:hypothetical protein